MRILLDTHVFLWWVSADKRLSRVGRGLIENPQNEVLVSAVVAWEIEIKRSLGKLRFQGEVAKTVTDQGFNPLAIDFRHTAETSALPMIHHDPFDRLLVAQARIESLYLLTVDTRVLSYPAQTIDCS